MFTGITQGTFEVVELRRQPTLLDYGVRLNEELTRDLRVGASVSIDGVCQTVVSVEQTVARFQAISETLARTTLDQLRLGDQVSVERAARLGDELGGHLLSGHIVGTGTISEVSQSEQRFELWVEVPGAWCKYLLPKGFVAVDGSSLTLGEVRGPDAGATEATGRFSLHLIPETLRVTNFARRRQGDRVNIELDAQTVAIVDTVERVLQRSSFGLCGGAEA